MRTKCMARSGRYPITDESGTPDGVCRFNHFRNMYNDGEFFSWGCSAVWGSSTFADFSAVWGSNTSDALGVLLAGDS